MGESATPRGTVKSPITLDQSEYDQWQSQPWTVLILLASLHNPRMF
jgi:hypothetical protein